LSIEFLFIIIIITVTHMSILGIYIIELLLQKKKKNKNKKRNPRRSGPSGLGSWLAALPKTGGYPHDSRAMSNMSRDVTDGDLARIFEKCTTSLKI